MGTKLAGAYRNGAGDTVGLGTITVHDAGTSTLATIYSDAALATPTTNPFTGDADGSFRFFVAPGAYKVTASKSGFDSWSEDYLVAAPLPVVVDIRDWGALVDGTTDDTVAVQRAITNAPAGSTLYFPPGTTVLAATLNIAKSLSVVGAPGSVVDARLPLATEQYLFNCTADNVMFESLTIDASNAPAGTLTIRHIGILALNVDNFTVRGCRFLNFSRKGAHDTGSTGDESTKSEFGIYATGGTNIRIFDNEMTEVSGAGVFIDASESVWIERNRITMLSISDSLYPIHVESATNAVWIKNNHVSGGERASGGAIDVMSNTAATPPATIKRVYVVDNLLEETGGFGSGSEVIRVLSVDHAIIRDNIIRAIPASTSEMAYISVSARIVAPLPEQPGASNVLIEGNILECGAVDQRAIDVRNDNAAGIGGENIAVLNNFCISDGTNYFAGGIWMRDISYGRICGNVVHQKHDATFTVPWAICVSTAKGAMLLPLIEGNDIDCFSIAGSRGIVVLGSAGGNVQYPIVKNNIIRNAAQRGVEFTASLVNDPTFVGNKFYNCPTPLNNGSTGNTTAHGNHFTETAARSGTWTIGSGTSSVDISNAEIRTGDRVHLTVTTNTGNEKPVKLAALGSGTLIRVRTMDGTAVAGDISGTWQIEH